MNYSEVQVVSREHGKIEFTFLPSTTKNVVTIQATGAFGKIIVDEIQTVTHKIWHSRFNMQGTMHLSLKLLDETPGIRIIFNMKNRTNFSVNGRQMTRLRLQYNLIYNPESTIEYVFSKGTYAAFVIFIPYQWLLHKKDYDLEIASILEQIDQQKSFTITKNSTAHMRDIVDKLLNGINKRPIYIEGKILELLNHIFDQSNTSQQRFLKQNFSDNDIQKIEYAMEYIQENMSKPCTIAELSKEVGITPLKLKIGFRQLYGFTIHHLVQDERMTLASKLLSETDKSIKEIAHLVGFSSHSHFSTAFKKWHGYSARLIKRRYI